MSWPSRVRKLLALRCEEASLLVSQAIDEPVSRWDRLSLWGHLLACRSCRRFGKQLRRIGEAYRQREAGGWDAEPPVGGLSEPARSRIAVALQHATREDGPADRAADVPPDPAH